MDNGLFMNEYFIIQVFEDVPKDALAANLKQEVFKPLALRYISMRGNIQHVALLERIDSLDANGLTKYINVYGLKHSQVVEFTCGNREHLLYTWNAYIEKLKMFTGAVDHAGWNIDMNQLAVYWDK